MILPSNYTEAHASENWYFRLLWQKIHHNIINGKKHKKIRSILQKTNIFNSGIYYLICLLSWFELISNFILLLQHLLCAHFLHFLHLHVISLHSTCICLFSSWFLHLVLSIAQLWWLDSWKWGILAL